jgi:periplasmic protein TonB
MHMTSYEILKASLLDIVFDNRNKQYGAYALRKEYNHRMMISLILALSSIGLLFLFTRKENGDEKRASLPDTVVIRDFNLPEVKPKQPKMEELPSQQVAQKKFMDLIEIVRDDQFINNTVPHLDELIDVQVSDHNGTGDPFTGNQPAGQQQQGIGDGQSVAGDKAPEKPALIQREPEFPGGMRAWVDFLNTHLRVPDELEAGEKKTVLIRFLVSEEGEVTGFSVVQSAGRLYDSEVIRVLKKMPRWKPALQDSKAVSRSYTQPVTFMGIEE